MNFDVGNTTDLSVLFFIYELSVTVVPCVYICIYEENDIEKDYVHRAGINRRILARKTV